MWIDANPTSVFLCSGLKLVQVTVSLFIVPSLSRLLSLAVLSLNTPFQRPPFTAAAGYTVASVSVAVRSPCCLRAAASLSRRHAAAASTEIIVREPTFITEGPMPARCILK